MTHERISQGRGGAGRKGGAGAQGRDLSLNPQGWGALKRKLCLRGCPQVNKGAGLPSLTGQSWAEGCPGQSLVPRHCQLCGHVGM